MVFVDISLRRNGLHQVQEWSSSRLSSPKWPSSSPKMVFVHIFFAKMGFVKFKNGLRRKTTMLWLNILFLKYYTLMALRFGFNHQSSISLCRGLKYWSKGHAKWSVCHLFGPWCGRRRPPWPTSALAKMDTAQKHTSKADRLIPWPPPSEHLFWLSYTVLFRPAKYGWKAVALRSGTSNTWLKFAW